MPCRGCSPPALAVSAQDPADCHSRSLASLQLDVDMAILVQPLKATGCLAPYERRVVWAPTHAKSQVMAKSLQLQKFCRASRLLARSSSKDLAGSNEFDITQYVEAKLDTGKLVRKLSLRSC